MMPRFRAPTAAKTAPREVGTRMVHTCIIINKNPAQLRTGVLKWGQPLGPSQLCKLANTD